MTTSTLRVGHETFKKTGMISSFSEAVSLPQGKSKKDDWLLPRQDLEKYEGKWVAVRGNKIVAFGQTLRSMFNKLKGDTEDLTITRIPKANHVLIL